jgi:two-component system phosphate regulon sensor histidine kinase PhoR
VRHRNFLWKLFFPFLILFIVALAFFGIYTSKVFKDFYIQNTTESLKSRTYLIKDELTSLKFDSASYVEHLQTIDRLSDTRITIISSTGKVLADSRENPALMDNHRERPEVSEAFKGNVGFSIRYSNTLKTDLMYVAVPWEERRDESGKSVVLRCAMPLYDIDKPFTQIYTTIVVGGIITILLAALMAFMISQRIYSSVNSIKTAAERYAAGDFTHKIYPFKNRDLNAVGEALNQMAQQLDHRLRLIGEQKNIQQAVLESMREGVLAVDYDERILLVNQAAENILSISDTNVVGKTLQEVVRVSEIHKFFKKILSEGVSSEAEIIIPLEKEKTLQLIGTNLYDINSKAIGALVVLNDISNIRYIDTIKKDLVANVSHELKTPLTTIKGFIETLRDGAIENKADAERFLDIISKHIERLNLIIDDLLTLSRLEEKATAETINKSEVEVLPLLKSAAEDYFVKAGEKNINIEIRCPDDLHSKLNPQLIEQAIGNLIDNAIKYSDSNTDITISAKVAAKYLIIDVADQGWGIEKEHISRLFERFYRVDKSRSRDVGGTGLGLAIVKHIVNSHGGSVRVSSGINKGSVFTIEIPLS